MPARRWVNGFFYMWVRSFLPEMWRLVAYIAISFICSFDNKSLFILFDGIIKEIESTIQLYYYFALEDGMGAFYIFFDGAVIIYFCQFME